LNVIALSVHEKSGLHKFRQAAIQAADTNQFQNPVLFLNNQGGGLLNQAAKLYTHLLTEKAGPLTELIANFAGIQNAAAACLLSITTEVILGIWGQHMKQYPDEAKQLLNYFESPQLQEAVPTGLYLQTVIQTQDNRSNNKLINRIMTDNQIASTSGNNNKALTLLLALLVLVMGAGIAIYFWSAAPTQSNKVQDIDSPLVKTSSNYQCRCRNSRQHR
jgi:p-aminobenzoyl-glutamate transporter AbgT